MVHRWLALAAMVAAMFALPACPTPPDDDDATDDDDDATDDDDTAPVDCADPWDGSGVRLTDEAEERGVTVESLTLTDLGQEDGAAHVIVVAEDLDADGDVDLMVGDLLAGPTLYANDGTGHFDITDVDWAMDEQPQVDWLPKEIPSLTSVAVSATDLDGDGLPEIVNVGMGYIAIYQNLGDLQFAPYERIREHTEPFRMEITHSFGDVDGDGRLDLLLPTSNMELGPEPSVIHRLLLQDADGAFVPGIELEIEGGSDALLGVTTDFDGDGDADVFLPKDQGEHSGLWRNDGAGPDGPILVEVAQEQGIVKDWHAMGIDAADLNGDGLYDYIISDIGPPSLLMSSEFGYVETADAVGLTPEVWKGESGTVGWSVEFADVDNDGLVDVLHASGKAYEVKESLPDLAWRQGSDGQFEDVTVEWGLGDPADNYGLAAADFDGDGFLDVVIGSDGPRPLLLMNRCTDASWLQVDPIGPPGNAQAFGARVAVTAAGESAQVREIMSLRALGQSPSLAHFGLGDGVDAVDVEVRWPDGTTTSLDGVETKRRLRVEHPAAR